MKSLIFLLMTVFLNLNLVHAFSHQGRQLPNLVLEGDDGGRLDGSKWSLEEMLKLKKVIVIFYVDPDEKDKNEEISQRLNKRNFASENIQYLGMINLAATWLPNFAISELLKKKQRKYPRTLYLRDYNKKVVKAWGVADDENDIIVLDKKGKVVFHKFGYLNKEEGDKLMELLEKLTKESP